MKTCKSHKLYTLIFQIFLENLQMNPSKMLNFISYHPSKNLCTMFVPSSFFIHNLILVIFSYSLHWNVDMVSKLLFAAHCTKAMFITCIILVSARTMSNLISLKLLLHSFRYSNCFSSTLKFEHVCTPLT